MSWEAFCKNRHNRTESDFVAIFQLSVSADYESDGRGLNPLPFDRTC